MSVNVDPPATKPRNLAALGALAVLGSALLGRCDRPVATAVVGIVGVVGIASSIRSKVETTLFDLDWRLAQDEDQIAANTDRIDRALALLDQVVPGEPSGV
jgi:hypothetical protein